MAEQLGQAELVLQLNDKDLRKGLEELRKEIAKLDAKPLELTVKGADTATKALKNISTQADAAATRVRTLNQLLNDFPSGSYSGLSAQIKKLSQETLSLQLNSDKYLQTLTRIKELEGIRQFKAGRQAARAGEAAYGPDGALGQLDQSQLPQLPITLEGQAQNIRELQQRLRNLNYESADYAETLRVLQRAQREYDNTLSGTSSTYRELEQAEERAIRRAEKLRGIQQYYAEQNPRAGGIRDDNGALRARGAGSAADERAYNASIRPSQELLQQDLQRVQALRQVTQRLQEQAALLDQIRSKQGNQRFGSFGEASASNFSAAQDPVTKAIRRNQEKVAKRDSAAQELSDQLEDDLARVRQTRLQAERDAADATKRTAAAERQAAKDALTAATDRAQRRKDAVGNAVIGGAFPLLFGQGIGAAIGGGVGGAAGGLAGGNFGFGLSLVGTAVGQQFDVAIQKVRLLGDALSDPISKFQELASAGLISSKSQETLIANLIKVGREAEAQALIQQDLVQTFGDLSAAKELSAATDELYRAFAQLTTLLANLAGPVLTGAIQGLAGLIRKYAQIAALDPERVKARERQATDVVASQIKPGQGSGFFGAVTVKFNGKTYKGSATGIREQIIRELLNQEVENATRTDPGSGQQAAKTTKELQEILNLRKQIKEAVNAQIVADSDGNKNESLRLQRLQVELNLQKELAKYNDSNDPGGVLREEARARAAEKLLKIDQELAKRPQAGSLGNAREELQTLQDLQSRLPVTSQAFAAVDRAIVRTTDALRGLEGAAAKVRFDSIQQGLDTGVITRSLTNLREQLQAAQTVVDNFNWDQLLVDPTAADQAIRDLVRVQDAVRKIDKQQAEVTVRVLGAEMATGTIAKSFNNLRDQLNAAQTVVDNFDFNSLSVGSQLAQQALNDIRALQGLPPLALDVGREKLAGAILDLVKIQDQINKIDGTKAQVTVEVIEKGIRNGQLTNNLNNLTAQRDAARQAFYNAPIDSPEQNKALQAYFRANSKVQKQEEKLNNTPEKQLEDAKRAAENVQQSFDRAKETVSQIKDELQSASERVADAFARALEAQRALRSSLEGAFQYLTADQKGRLEEAARRDVSIANSRGIFDSNATDKLKGQELIAAANSARGIFAAEDNVKKANADLETSQAALAGVNSKLIEATNNQVKAQGELSKAIGVLNEKNWTVNVNVPGGSASGDVVGAVNSRS